MNRKFIKYRLVILCMFLVGHLVAQQKMTKVSQSIDVNKDVTIDLNTSHCNIVIDTWNKDSVAIEAYIEGEQLTQKELEEALEAWNVDIDGSSNNVSITTKGGVNKSWAYIMHDDDHDVVKIVLDELKYELADLPEVVLGSLDLDIDVPEVPEMPEMPEMPEFPELPELPEGVNKIAFDYEAYKKDGEKYLEEWSKAFESKYGEQYARDMEEWGKKFGEEWGEQFGKDMEAWGEKFGKEWEEKYARKMEAWGDRYAEKAARESQRVIIQAERVEARAKLMEERAKHLEERSRLSEKRQKEIEKLIEKGANSNVKKTIKIKMPKRAKLKVDVKYGEIEFVANIDNLRADLSHTKFTAQSIDGGSTSINASYSPVKIEHWNLGELNLKYVQNANLGHVKHLVLNSTSSDIDIDNLLGSAVIDGNIGDLNIMKIADDFTNLNIILQNCKAVIKLPSTSCSVRYKGTRSQLSHPDKTSNDNNDNFFVGNMDSGKNILVNAKYSQVVLH